MPKKNLIALSVSAALIAAHGELSAMPMPVLSLTSGGQSNGFDDSGVTVIADGWDDEFWDDENSYHDEIYEVDDPFAIANLLEEQTVVLAYAGGYGKPKAPCSGYGGPSKLIIENPTKKGVVQGAAPGTFFDQSVNADGSVSLPGGGVLSPLPGGGFLLPNGDTITYTADGNANLPDGSIFQASGNFVLPNGDIYFRYGSFWKDQNGSLYTETTLQNGYTLLVDGYVRLTDGTQVYPTVTVQAGKQPPKTYPHGTLKTVNGYLVEPDGTVNRANGDRVHPGGEVSVSVDNLAINCGKTIPRGRKGYGGRVCQVTSCKSSGAVYDLKAVPETGFSFIKWLGACKPQGSNPICTVPLNKAQRKVKAIFKPLK